MAYQIMTLSGFINEVRSSSKGPYPRKFCFVLGAGASKTSGIKTGEELVEIWERELAERNPQAHEEWKRRLGITEKNRGNFYSDYYQRRFPRDNGRRCRDGYNYLEQLMDKARPSGGYVHLALIMANTMHNVVVTTNFDHLVEDSMVQYTQKMPMVIGHEKLAPYATEEIARPTVVKIHRDLFTDPISNPEELNKLHDEWVKVLDNIFSHYHPVFIGYAGNDNSVMDFLCTNVDKFNSKKWAFPYWLIYGNQPPKGKVKQFLENTDGYLVSHPGFDEVMVELSNALDQTLPSKEKFLEQTQKQYEALMDSAVWLVKNDSPDRVEQGMDRENKEESLDFSMDKYQSYGDIQREDEGNLYSQYLGFHSDGEYEKALNYIQRLVEQNPDKSRYYYSMGVTLYAMKRYRDALEVSRKATSLEPGNALYHHQLGIILHAMEWFEEEAEEEQKASELEPENAQYHERLGATLHRLKRYNEALEERQKAALLNPDNAKCHYDLSVTLCELYKYAEAIVEGRKAVSLELENALYHHQLSVILCEAWKYREGEVESRKAVFLEPENAEYHYKLAEILCWRNQYEEAVEEMKTVIQLSPNEPSYHSNLSSILWRMKRYEEAVEEMRTVIQLSPNEPSYYSKLSDILWQMKRYEEAVVEIKTAIQLSPNEPDYYDTLSCVLFCMGRVIKGMAMLWKAFWLKHKPW